MSRNALPVGLILAGLFLVAGNLRATLTTVGPVLPQMETDLGISSVAASFLMVLPLLAFAVVSPLAPRAARNLGLEPAIALSLGLLALGALLRSAPPLALLWVGTALIGVSIAVLNVLLPSLVKRDFPLKIGQVTGAYSAVQSMFAATAAGVAVPMAGATVLGWRLPLGMWAGLTLIALAVLAPQLRRRASDNPAGARTVAVTPSKTASSAPAQPRRSPWSSALAWQVTLFMGLQSTVFYVLITWLPSIEVAAGISEAAAGGHQFLLNASAIIGSLTCSALIPRLRDQRVLGVAVAVLMGTGTVGILLAPEAAALWACVSGIGCGGGIVLSLSFFGLRTRDHHQAASLSGMAQSIGYLLAAVGPLAVGALHEVTGSWTPALFLLLGVQTTLVIFGLLAGRARTLA